MNFLESLVLWQVWSWQIYICSLIHDQRGTNKNLCRKRKTCFNYIEFYFIEVLLYRFYLFNIKKNRNKKKRTLTFEQANFASPSDFEIVLFISKFPNILSLSSFNNSVVIISQFLKLKMGTSNKWIESFQVYDLTKESVVKYLTEV